MPVARLAVQIICTAGRVIPRPGCAPSPHVGTPTPHWSIVSKRICSRLWNYNPNGSNTGPEDPFWRGSSGPIRGSPEARTRDTGITAESPERNP
ncbi:hypothetical protein Taro_037499 [Colocasia esculenta]|uniref:Uncharacterized protein n=1 Tax=Colocasia esculenta TaxID=4460 RepID=A0A843WGH1_COLES|nr:hypothetical protein [Colocasia esculenta]